MQGSAGRRGGLARRSHRRLQMVQADIGTVQQHRRRNTQIKLEAPRDGAIDQRDDAWQLVIEREGDLGPRSAIVVGRRIVEIHAPGLQVESDHKLAEEVATENPGHCR